MQNLNSDLPYKHISNQFKGKKSDGNAHCLQAADCQNAFNSIASWPGYQPTPLRSLKGLASSAGVGHIFYKDEAPRFGLGSFKALGGAHAVSRLLQTRLAQALGHEVSIEALASGEHNNLTSEMVVSCATDGNHGRSVAWGARRFGCQCIIYIHADVSEGRRAAIENYGAEVIRIDGNYDDSVRLAAAEAEKHGRTIVSDTSYEGYLDIPADVMRGYTVLADEAFEQMQGETPTHVFLQGGVGGFAAAIAARVRARYTVAQPRIVVVEPDLAACIYESIAAGEPVPVHGDLATIMAGLACGEVSLIAFDILLQETDDVLVITDDTAIETMKLLATGIQQDSPLVSGESGVTGLAGALFARNNKKLAQTLSLDDNSSILVINTEGATDPNVYRELVGTEADTVDANWAGS